MKFCVMLITGAVLPFLFVSTLPTHLALTFLLAFALPVLVPGISARLKLLCLIPIFFSTTTLAINHRLSQRFPLSESGSIYELEGVIGSLPETKLDVVRFIFLPDDTVAPIPSRIQVSWYKDRGSDKELPLLRAGEHWRLQLELRSPRGRVNFHGTDAERWYFSSGIGALGYVQKGENSRLAVPGRLDVQHWRELVLDRLTETAGDVPSFRLLRALAIADRRGLFSHDVRILSATGTGHLLAISGLHIGLAAALGFYLGRLALLLLPVGLGQRIAVALPWWVAWFAALAYSALAGFGVSTQRALIMLTVVTVAVLSRRNIHPLLAWMIAMSLVLLTDPFAPLRAGFWFSFVAVAVLLMLFVPLQGRMPAWRKMLYAQMGISLIMAPLGMYWFQQASFPGLLANLFAIPVVSMWIVPLLLGAMPLMWLPGPLAGWLLAVAGHSAHYLLLILEYLSGFQPLAFSTTRSPGLIATVLAMCGAAILLLPRGIPGRYMGFLLIIPVLLPAGQVPGKMEVQLDFLDVGQGLAVLLAEQNYLMVYDTGPGNGLSGETGWDMVGGTIQPMIRSTGKTPDLVVASHADLDHAGGLERLGRLYPGARFLASLPVNRTGIQACRSSQVWASEKLSFSVLHPSAGLPYLGNNSSCVISVNGPGLSLLLSGDVSRVVERRLVQNGLGQHAFLTAPHHGSSTSSSQALIDAVRPSLALISAGHNNRFDFPRADVLERYAKAQVRTLNTARCGGIRIKTDVGGSVSLESARVSRKNIWRWPAGAGCP